MKLRSVIVSSYLHSKVGLTVLSQPRLTDRIRFRLLGDKQPYLLSSSVNV